MNESTQVGRRRHVLAAAVERFQPENEESLSGVTELPRFCIVQSYRQTLDGHDLYWFDLTDNPRHELTLLAAAFHETGWLPFLVVDLDDGLAYDVDLVFEVGDTTSDTRYDFSDVVAPRA
jgi:hypothetical protein